MFEDISKVVLLTDMDGTLLNSKKQINDADRRAIEKFMALGGGFTVATGRTIQSFEPYCCELDLKLPLIMYNGAALYDYERNRILYLRPLPPEAKEITKDIINSFSNIGGEVLKADGTYVFCNNSYESLHTVLCRIQPHYAEIDSISDGDWLKVLFAMAPEDVQLLEIFVNQRNYETVDFVKSSDIFYEMLAPNVTKGSALAEYRKISGFEDCTFVAIGDFNNDIEMIREADLGAAPSNAQDEVKQAADIVLENSCDTGAIAELVDYIIERCGK